MRKSDPSPKPPTRTIPLICSLRGIDSFASRRIEWVVDGTARFILTPTTANTEAYHKPRLMPTTDLISHIIAAHRATQLFPPVAICPFWPFYIGFTTRDTFSRLIPSAICWRLFCLYLCDRVSHLVLFHFLALMFCVTNKNLMTTRRPFSIFAPLSIPTNVACSAC